jgi:hypothetical protein
MSEACRYLEVFHLTIFALAGTFFLTKTGQQCNMPNKPTDLRHPRHKANVRRSIPLSARNKALMNTKSCLSVGITFQLNVLHHIIGLESLVSTMQVAS